jgi:hypothetical protein
MAFGPLPMHNVDTWFRENLSSGSQAETRDTNTQARRDVDFLNTFFISFMNESR